MEDFTPANRLEQLLDEAAHDVGKRPAFYREFLNSRLLVLGSANPPETGGHTGDKGTPVTIVHWQAPDGRVAVPAFSSLPRLQEAIKGEEPYLELDASTLLDLLGKDTLLVLNPMSAVGKEFIPDEIAALRDGSILKEADSFVVPKDQQVLLAQPANYPHELVQALISLFSEHSEVQSAYLAQIHYPSTEEPPHLMIGIKTTGGDISSLVSEAGMVVGTLAGKGEMVDFVQITEGPDDGLSGYMTKSTQPFYLRANTGPNA